LTVAKVNPHPANAASRRAASLLRWLDERLYISALRDKAAEKTVPVHRFMPFYYFGGMTLFFFGVQIGTGILLMLYYRPSAEGAFESVEFIMVFSAFAHLASVYLLKAYRPPRELTWVSGCLILFLTMGFGFSGYLLPWNQLAFFATKVGTDTAGAVPVVGDWIVRFLRGGERVTGGTLSRFYGWHVAILPAVTAALLGLHLLFVQIHGMSLPPQIEREGPRPREMNFFPHFVLREMWVWTLALGVLAALAALFPWELGEKADPFAPAYKDIKPEWYFMFMFQTLKLVPGGEIAGIEYEAFPILLFGLAGALLVAVPFLDRGAAQTGRSPAFTAIGVMGLAYIVGMTSWGYASLVPVYVVVVLGGIVYALMRRAPRPPGGPS
jgi:cytochrome b6